MATVMEVVERRRVDETDGDEFVLVPDAGTYDDDEVAHEPRVLAGGYSEKSIDANYLPAAARRQRDAFDNDEEVEPVEEVAANGSKESCGVEEDVVVVVAEEEEGGHGWQQHAVGMLCSVGLAATAAGVALLLGGGGGGGHRSQKPLDTVNFRAAGDYKAANVAARRDARLEQGISVARAEHAPAPAPAPAVISFGGCKTCNDGKMF